MDIVGNQSLGSIWDERVREYPNRLFLVSEDRLSGDVKEYTYASFDIEVSRTANAFRSLGISKGDKVVIHLDNCPEYIMCWFALAKIGAIMVASNVKSSASECSYVFDRCDAVAVVTEPVYRSVVCKAAAMCSRLKMVLLEHACMEHPDAIDFSLLRRGMEPVFYSRCRVLGDDDLEIMFTSGSSGRPKPMVFTHANALYAGVLSAYEAFFQSDDRMLTALPAYHVDFQFMATMPVLYAGATLVIVGRYSASRFWGQVRRHRATLTQIYPFHMRTLMAQPALPTDEDHCVREAFFSLCHTEQERLAFQRRFKVSLLNCYGMSETVIGATVHPVYGERRWPSVGRPAIAWKIKIIDEKGFELPPREVGEICVQGERGKTLMKGYYRDPEATAKLIDDENWVHTGDLGYVDDEGWLYYLDRIKNVLKCSGENVSAAEVECVLTDHPDIQEAAVIGVPDPLCDQAIKAYVMLRVGSLMTEDDIVAYCAAMMAPFKVPASVEIRKDFPRTGIGKVDKRALEALEERGACE